MLTTNLKGDSSMKLHRDLRITQKSALHPPHRIRETSDRGEGLIRRFPLGKTPAAGAKDRATNERAA